MLAFSDAPAALSMSKLASRRGSAVSVTRRDSPGHQRDTFEGKQAEAGLARGAGEIELRDVGAIALTAVGDGDHRRHRVAAMHFEIAIGKARVAQAVTERVSRLEALPRVPAISGVGALIIADRGRRAPGRAEAGQFRPRRRAVVRATSSAGEQTGSRVRTESRQAPAHRPAPDTTPAGWRWRDRATEISRQELPVSSTTIVFRVH